MSAFDPDDDLSEDVAFRLMWNTPVTLFWRRQLLNETIQWLSERGYQVVALDASSWAAEADLHRAIAGALDFPGHYGRNLDALNDCMRDVVAREYGWVAGATGLVVVLTAYDGFARADPRTAHAVLDIMASHSRAASLVGGRLMCLVQSNDPSAAFDEVGAVPVMWNSAEWLDRNRGSN